MASKRYYGYYVKGNQIALAEQEVGGGVCSLSGYSNQTTCEAAGGTWTENAIGNNYGEWRSPVASVTDGLEIQYTYVHEYQITDTSKVDTNITSYRSNDGYLEISDATSSYTNYGNLSGYNITDGSYIVLKNAGKWNGLHKTITKSTTNGTNDTIKLNTKYQGSSSWSTFEETVNLYYYVDAMVDESFDIDLPRYQAIALSYYVKAKLLEDSGDIDGYEYFMRQFKRQLEKSKSALKKGPHRMGGFMNRI